MNREILDVINAVICYGKWIRSHDCIVKSGENYDHIAAMEKYYHSLPLPEGMAKNRADFDRILQIGWYSDEELRRLNSMEENDLSNVSWKPSRENISKVKATKSGNHTEGYKMTKQDKELFWMNPGALQILQEAQTKVKLDYDDDTELLGYERIPDTKYDIWLAVYDERLYWTLDCFNEEYDDYDNVEGMYFSRRDIKDVELTRDSLCALSKKIMAKLIKRYEHNLAKEQEENEFSHKVTDVDDIIADAEERSAETGNGKEEDVDKDYYDCRTSYEHAFGSGF